MLVLKNRVVKTELPKVWSAPSRTSRIRADEGSGMDIHVILDYEVGKHHSTCSVLPFTLSVTIFCKRSSMCSNLTECVRRTSWLNETDPCSGAVEDQNTSVRSFGSSFASHTDPHLLSSLFPLMYVKKGLTCHLGRLWSSSKVFLCEVLYPLKFDISWIFINSDSWEIIT